MDWNWDPEDIVIEIELHVTMDMFAALPALQTLHIVCSITAWNLPVSSYVMKNWRVCGKQTCILKATETAVKKKLGEVLKGRDVKVTVEIGMNLKGDRACAGKWV